MEQIKQNDNDWYSVFLSIIFGVFISVWIQPFAGEIMHKTKILGPDNEIQSLMVIFRAILMFGILICLWWWYSQFLARISPATGFLMYAFDFISLAFFSLAFRFWDPTGTIFPVSVFFGSLFMFVRFLVVFLHSENIGKDTGDYQALRNIMILLTLFMFFLGGGAFVMMILSYKGVLDDSLLKAVIDVIILALLFLGIIATLVSVRSVEKGFNWGYSPNSQDEIDEQAGNIVRATPRVPKDTNPSLET